MKTIFKVFVMLVLIESTAFIKIYSQSSSADYQYISSVKNNLSAPVKFAIDASDNIYVTDGITKNIKKYNSTGSYIESINVGVSPLSIAINNSGHLFVGDGENGKIYKVETTGVSSVFYTGCSFPSSMTFNPDGNLYVVDGELKRVLVLDISGKVIQTIGAGTLIFPSEIVYDKANSRILIAEHGGVGTGFNPPCKIWKFNLAGVLQGSFASAGNGDGQFYRIQGMTIGKCGNLYVCDPFQGNISVFDENNNFITRFGQFGTQDGNLNVPMDILFDSKDRAIIASMNNGSLEIFNINDALPTSNIVNSDATICTGESANIQINFTGTAPWTFTYTTDGLNPIEITTSENPHILNTSVGGLYEVVAISDLNKTGTCFSGSAKIKVNSSIPTSNISLGSVSVCAGGSIEIPVQFTGTSPWTLTYTKDGINPKTVTTANNPYIISTLEAGLYEVTSLSAGGCVGSAFVGNASVSINSIPSTVTVNNSISICQGSISVLPIELTGNGPWSFTYTIDNSNPNTITTAQNIYDLTVSEAGVYRITSIADLNCSSNISQTIAEVDIKQNPTSVMTSVNTSICYGDIAVIPIEFTGNPPFEFTYSINETDFIDVSTTDNQFVLQVNKEGNYKIENLSSNGCISSNNIGTSDILINPLPTSSFIDGNNQFTICDGEVKTLPISLTGTAPWVITYSINNIEQSSITTSENPYVLTVNKSGFYEVVKISDALCLNVSTIGNPEVVVNPLPTSILSNDNAEFCVGSSVSVPVEFTGIAPWNFTYTIDGLNPNLVTTSDNPFNIQAYNTGIYQVSDISSHNCIGTDITGSTIVIERGKVYPSFIFNNNGLEITFTNNSQNASSYFWTFGDGQTSTDVNPIHIYQSPDIYTVMVTASNGVCADSTLTQIINLIGLSVNSSNSESNISFFPNPSNGNITVAIIGNNQKDWTIEITNSLGQLIKAGNYYRSLENIDLTELPTGIYTIKIISEGISKTEKLVINN